MKQQKAERAASAHSSSWMIRASISFPSDLYKTLERLAKRKKVSLAWVVRDAAEKYVAGHATETDGQVKAN